MRSCFIAGTNKSPYSKWDYGSPRTLLRRKEPEPMYIESDSSDGDSTVQSVTLNSTTSSSTTASIAAVTSGTPNRSGIYTSLFSESPSSSSRKRKHSSNTSQPTPEHHNKKHRHTEPTECDNSPSQSSYRKNPLKASQFPSRENSSRPSRDEEDFSNISSEGCVALDNKQNEILWEGMMLSYFEIASFISSISANVISLLSKNDVKVMQSFPMPFRYVCPFYENIK